MAGGALGLKTTNACFQDRLSPYQYCECHYDKLGILYESNVKALSTVFRSFTQRVDNLYLTFAQRHCIDSRVHFHGAVSLFAPTTMSGPPRPSKPSSSSNPPDSPTYPSEEGKQWEYRDCISCRVVGTGALGLTGLYALHMARPRAPGSIFGKMMMAGIGVGELAYFVLSFHSLLWQS